MTFVVRSVLLGSVVRPYGWEIVDDGTGQVVRRSAACYRKPGDAWAAGNVAMAEQVSETVSVTKRLADLELVIRAIRDEGATSLHQIALAMNERGIPASHGGVWSAVQVSRVLSRLMERTKETAAGMPADV